MKKKRRIKHKKYTQNQLAFKKEIARIKRFISRAEKRGYSFDFEIPDLPKRVTKKTIEKLKESTTPDKLYQKSVYCGVHSYGEKIAGSEGIKLERSARAKKAAKTRQLNKESERIFWGYDDAMRHYSELPIGGETAYRNALEQFISRLSTQPLNYDYSTGRKRTKYAVKESEEQKKTLLDLVNEEVSKTVKEKSVKG